MTRLGACARLLLLLLLAPPVAAQTHGDVDGAEVGPLPPGDGVIEVRIQRSRGASPAGLDVMLYALPPDGAPGLARARSGPEGRAVFEGVSADPAIPYLVGVRADGVPYGEGFAFEEGRARRVVEVEVPGADRDVSQARLGEAMVRIDRGCDAVRVSHSHPIENPSDAVLVVPPEQRGDAEPVLHLELPLQAGPLTSLHGMTPQGLERDGRTVRFWGPVYPGSQELDFGYFLPLEAPEAGFEWRFPAGAPEASWLAPEAGGRLRSAALTPAEPREIDGASYTVLRGSGIARGAAVRVAAELAPPEAPPLEARGARIIIDLDDALLVANERHDLAVEGGDALPRSPAPLLCLTLPAGADAIRLGDASMAMGPSSEPSGAIAFHGPIPAGESALNLSYEQALAGDAAVFARRFPLDLPLLEVFVIDTGVRPHTTRLHRMQPIRDADRNYSHLQGFAIEREEEVRVELERLPAPRPLPRLAATGFGLLAAGATFVFLIGPLRRERPDETLAPSRAAELAAERESVYGVIRDLDEDFETGKLSAEDHAAMRREMRERAVDLLRRERAAQAAEEEAAVDRCGACGEPLPAGARFCPQCGARAGDADA